MEFYKSGGLEEAPAAMEKEFALRPVFLLDKQLGLIARSDGASEVEGWTTIRGQTAMSRG